ncbi:MAG: hypothetical protein OES13_08920, partial [Acidimicrobiia bacterium]|nr:hypothetical protein [Acidimicrobiia bacterium]
LFADRAAAARGDFAVSEANRAAVIDTCRRLDGLPLALELAAARLAVLSITELYGRLDQRFELLVNAHMTDDRHRAMWATVDWSHELLTRQGQVLLQRLAVMHGTFDVDAVAGVCLADSVGDAEVLELITELVENSFLRSHRDPEDGFSMLETIREYANHNLELSGEADVLRERHARYFARRAAARPSPDSLEELEYLDRMRTDSENHTVALDWSLQQGLADLSIRLAAGLALHWYTAGRGDDALRWLVPALSEGEGAASVERAEALCSLGLTLPWMGRHDEAAAIAAELDRVAAELQEPGVEADALWVRAAAATVGGDIAESRRWFDRAASLLRAADHPKLSVFLFDLARRELMLGNADRAVVLVDELEQLDLRWGQPLTAARVPLLHGLIMHFHGDLSGALSHLTSSLGEMRRLGQVGPQVDALRAVCDVAVSAERWEMAESAAREFTRLTMATGEIADLPHGNDALAEVSLARDELDQASHHVAAGLATLRKTRSAFALDHTLLTAASIAVARERTEAAAMLHAARRRRRDNLGLVDAVPVANRVEREMQQLRAERNDEWGSDGPDQLRQRSLLDLAAAAVAP